MLLFDKNPSVRSTDPSNNLKCSRNESLRKWHRSNVLPTITHELRFLSSSDLQTTLSYLSESTYLPSYHPYNQ